MKMTTTVYGCYEKPNTGDYNNTQAVYNALQGNNLTKGGFVALTELSTTIEKAQSSEGQNIIIVTGEAGAKAVNEMKNIPANVKVFWTGHQTSELLTQAVEAKKINSVFIANSGISNSNAERYKKHCDVVKLPGVPVEVDEGAAKKLRFEKENAFLKVSKGQKRIIVFLGGDAPDIEGKYAYITHEDGKKIGQQLAQMAKEHNAVIEIVNGPRTGQRDPKTGEETLAHHKYDPKTGMMLAFEEDEASKGVREGLESNGLKKGKDFQIHDFEWGTQKLTPKAKEIVHDNEPTVSMYDPAMGLALTDKEAIVVYTSESITEGNKLARYFTGRKTYAMLVPSMHEGHKDFLQDLFERGYVGKIDPEQKTVQEPSKRETVPLNALDKLTKKMQTRLSQTSELFRNV